MYTLTPQQESQLIIKARKANYWRGFKACLILVVAPITITFVIFCHYIINQTGV